MTLARCLEARKIMKQNPVRTKATAFAVRIIRMCRTLRVRRVERELLSQVLKSGTSIGANISEAQNAISRAEFHSKIQIALKEAAETEYWLEVLHTSESLSHSEYASLNDDCQQLLRILTTIAKRVSLPKDASTVAPILP